MSKGRHSPLDPHIDTFIVQLTARNYKPQTIGTYRVLLKRLASRIKAARISLQDLTPERAAKLVRRDDRIRREPNKRQNMARRFVTHLIDSGVVPAPTVTPRQIAREALRADYEDYLVRQRGISPSSVYSAWRFADRFLVLAGTPSPRFQRAVEIAISLKSILLFSTESHIQHRDEPVFSIERRTTGRTRPRRPACGDPAGRGCEHEA